MTRGRPSAVPHKLRSGASTAGDGILAIKIVMELRGRRLMRANCAHHHVSKRRAIVLNVTFACGDIRSPRASLLDFVEKLIHRFKWNKRNVCVWLELEGLRLNYPDPSSGRDGKLGWGSAAPPLGNHLRHRSTRTIPQHSSDRPGGVAARSFAGAPGTTRLPDMVGRPVSRKTLVRHGEKRLRDAADVIPGAR